MHDGGAPEWREIVEKSHLRLAEELAVAIGAGRAKAIDGAIAAERANAVIELERAKESTRLALEKARAECDETVSRSRAAARQAAAEALNQALRRIRQSNSTEATLTLLAELCSGYANKTVVLVFENHQARIAAVRGVEQNTSGESNGNSSGAFELALEDAPALASVVESRDPVAVLTKESEISPALVRLLAAAPADKLYLFPVTARQHVLAVLVALGEVFPAGAELLAEASGMRLESIAAAARETAAETLVKIQSVVPSSATSDRRTWDDLSPEDQQLHLQAQRVARVRVAKMRLDREDAWRRGLVQGDVYGALRREIESARTEFLQTFLSRSSTMVDYLHLEILRNLANDNDRLLGREYPGPMV